MLQKAERALNKLTEPLASITNYIAGGLLVIMTITVLLQVFFRYILNDPLSWTDEASRFLMIYMTYLCLPVIYLQDKNIAMTFLLEKLKGKRIIHLVNFIIHCLALLVFSIWVKFGYSFFQGGSVRADSIDIPMYVIYIAPPVMLAITCIYCVQKLIGELHLFLSFQTKEM